MTSIFPLSSSTWYKNKMLIKFMIKTSVNLFYLIGYFVIFKYFIYYFTNNNYLIGKFCGWKNMIYLQKYKDNNCFTYFVIFFTWAGTIIDFSWSKKVFNTFESWVMTMFNKSEIFIRIFTNTNTYWKKSYEFQFYTVHKGVNTWRVSTWLRRHSCWTTIYSE